MNKIEKAILNELKEWDLTCSEEPSLKIELAKAIAKAVKNCNIPPVINCKPKRKVKEGDSFFEGWDKVIKNIKL